MLRNFGRFALSKLIEKVSDWPVNNSYYRDFLLTVDNIIHVELHKLYKDATPFCGRLDKGFGEDINLRSITTVK